MMDLIISWLCTGIAALFAGIAKFFTGLFGYDIAQFNYTFSFAADAYGVIRKVALALSLVIAAWQIITFFVKGSEASTTPIRSALNAVIAIGFIFYGNYLLELVLDFCQFPYDAINNIPAIRDAGAHYTDYTWTDFVISSMRSAFAGTSMLLYLVMLILICFSFVKLLLEIVERYVVTFVLLYLSPLASATLASSATSGIFKKFITMFFSQCLLLFLNVWCLRMACSGLALSAYEGDSFVVPLLLCYAFLRISAKMDSYVNQLGLNAAITGAGLGSEILATGMALAGAGKKGGVGLGGEAGNKVLGAMKTVQTYANRYTFGGAAKSLINDTITGGFGGASEAFRSGGNILKGFGQGAGNAAKASDNAFSNFAASSTKREAVANGMKDIGDTMNPNKPASTGPVKFEPGYRESLNERLVTPAIPPERPVGYDEMAADNPQKMEYDNAQNAYNARQERSVQDIKDVSSNQHLATSAFNYVQEGENRVIGDKNGGETKEVAAVAKGLGIGNVSKEASEFIKVGMGQGEGTTNEVFYIDKTGMHNSYEKDGYTHKMDVYNQKQFRAMSTEQREGLIKVPAADGTRYYVRMDKAKTDTGDDSSNPGKKSSRSKSQNDTPADEPVNETP